MIANEYATLRFPTRAHAVAACQALGYWDDENDAPISSGQIRGEDGTRGFSISEIGTDPVIEPATYDEEGVLLTAAVHAEGYYVNICGLLPEAVAPFRVPYGSAGMILAGSEAFIGTT